MQLHAVACNAFNVLKVIQNVLLQISEHHQVKYLQFTSSCISNHSGGCVYILLLPKQLQLIEKSCFTLLKTATTATKRIQHVGSEENAVFMTNYAVHRVDSLPQQ